MGFKATDYVEPLDFDFRPHYDYNGTITEPSDQDISRFLRKWYHLIGEMRKSVAAGMLEAAVEDQQGEVVREAEEATGAPTSFEEAAEAMKNIDWDALDDDTDQSVQVGIAKGVLKQMCRLVEDLGHGSIRADKLEKVPMRLRGVFFGWLVGELTEQGKGTTGLNSGSVAKLS